MKCRNCKYNGFLADDDGTQYSWCDIVSDNLDPDEERECRHYARAVHGDQLRAMTDEELARIIVDDWCVIVCEDAPVCDGQCESRVLDWLRQEVEE